MKVSIITRHAIPNYGSVLQSYASQKAFEQLGYDAEILNYVRYDERGKQKVWSNCHISQGGLKNKLKRAVYFCLQYPNSQKMLKTFEGFQKQYLRLSAKTYGSMEELTEDLPEADVFVTGSDQVWGQIGAEEYDPAFFLKFVPADKHQIAFSASFGKTDLDSTLVQQLDAMLANYNGLLVREKSAKQIIEQHTNKTAEHILDPTLLLDQEQWSQLCEPTGLEGKEYIFVYQLHHNKEMERYITKLQKQTGLPVYRAHPSIFYSLKPGNFIHLPTPGQFLSYIKNAKYMVTDSFHGSVFCLIFNTQFVDIIPETTGTRIYSLLDMVGLQRRILADGNDFSWMEDIIDFAPINDIVAQERQKTMAALANSLPKNNQSVAQMNLHQQCSGCGTCAQLCPTGAIHMEADEEGFLMPKVDSAKCIDCGLCHRRCPQLNAIQREKTQQAGYAARMKNDVLLQKSASGGVFTQAAQQYLQAGGVVYGAAMLEDLSVSHIRVDGLEDLEKLQGSKYVQSHTVGTFAQVKADLEADLAVLFCGTPCQVAGLHAFLGKEYEKLCTMDIICHGVPSQKLLQKSIALDQQKKNSTMVSYVFRSKENCGWGNDYKFKKTFADGKVFTGCGKQDVYYKAFLEGEAFRECCYQCRYANMDRPGDLTIGDFWGIEKELPAFYAEAGASCVLVNTQKGQQVFAQLQQEMEVTEVSCQQIHKHNHNLSAPTPRKTKRNAAYLNIDQLPFNKMDLYRLHRFDLKAYISYKMPKSLKKKLKKLLKG